MLEIMLFMLNLSWKILGIACGWILLKYLLRNGKGTFKEVLETLGSAIKTGCYFIRKKLADSLRKEKATIETTSSDDVRQLSQEEFDKMMMDKESFVL